MILSIIFLSVTYGAVHFSFFPSLFLITKIEILNQTGDSELHCEKHKELGCILKDNFGPIIYISYHPVLQPTVSLDFNRDLLLFLILPVPDIHFFKLLPRSAANVSSSFWAVITLYQTYVSHTTLLHSVDTLKTVYSKSKIYNIITNNVRVSAIYSYTTPGCISVLYNLISVFFKIRFLYILWKSMVWSF